MRIGSSLGQFLFRTTIFLAEKLFRINIPIEGLPFPNRHFCTASKDTFWKKVIFQKIDIPHYLLFLESHFFRAATFSKDATFYSWYLFRRALSLQNTFSEELIFVMLCAIWYYLCNLKNVKNTHGEVLILVKLSTTFYSYASFPQLHFLFTIYVSTISVQFKCETSFLSILLLLKVAS